MPLAPQDAPLMTEAISPKLVCSHCTASLDADDNYCRRCGAATPLGIKLGVRPSANHPAAWESPWIILPLLFFVLGPLALPLLWRSHCFTRTWKIILTVVVAIETVLLVWSSWIVIKRAFLPLRQVLEFGKV